MNQSTKEYEEREIVKLDDGRIYKGMWIKGEDVMEGRGILIWAGGSRFDGYFENNGVGSYGRLIT